mgnify:CR=1 FL=1
MRTALVNLIFYALFAPACGQMINRIMYMSEAVMERTRPWDSWKNPEGGASAGGVTATKGAGHTGGL